MRILIVEDEETLASVMKKTLRQHGYAVDHVADGQRAINRIKINHSDYDLILLDLSLPHKDGLEISKEVRQLNITTPILILTANNKTSSKVSLLNTGADDYLVKPFAFEELLSRIGAITRRPKRMLPTELQVGDIILNPATQKVHRAGREVKLTLREFRILEYFMRNPNIVLSREDITSNIWDFNYDSFSNVLDVFISKIREKIGNNNYPRLIETVRGIGYRFNTAKEPGYLREN